MSTPLDFDGPAVSQIAVPPIADPLPEDSAPDAAPRPKSKRATTRAGRRAEAEARKLADTTKPKATKPAPRKSTLEKRLTDNLVGLGTVVAAAGGMVNPALTADGILITQHAAAVAKALDKVAADQPAVKAALERTLTAGVWSGLVAAMAPLAIGIAANHGLLPAGIAEALGEPETPADG